MFSNLARVTQKLWLQLSIIGTSAHWASTMTPPPLVEKQKVKTIVFKLRESPRKWEFEWSPANPFGWCRPINRVNDWGVLGLLAISRDSRCLIAHVCRTRCHTWTARQWSRSWRRWPPLRHSARTTIRLFQDLCGFRKLGNFQKSSKRKPLYSASNATSDPVLQRRLGLAARWRAAPASVRFGSLANEQYRLRSGPDCTVSVCVVSSFVRTRTTLDRAKQ